MPHTDCLYNSVQSRNTDPVQVNNSVNIFMNEIKKIYNKISIICKINTVQYFQRKEKLQKT